MFGVQGGAEDGGLLALPGLPNAGSGLQVDGGLPSDEEEESETDEDEGDTAMSEPSDRD